jgi:hypothetical protein
MTTVDYTIVSIGTMSRNRLWGEQADVRTQHATATLLRHEDRVILVDPSLPGQVMGSRLFERTGLQPEAVTDIFCTNLRPDFRRGLDGFPTARCWCNEQELEWYGLRLEGMADSASRLSEEEAEQIEQEQTLRRFAPAPEKFTEQIGLYPLAGATPGCAGLLLTPATQTIIVAGPAVPTRGHLLGGTIWDHCADREAAMESLQDVLELADLVIPGFDNIFPCPQRML